MSQMLAPILQEFEQEKAVTRKVLERVPEDKLTWKPHPRSMSLGQLALHTASVPRDVTGMALQDTFEVGGMTFPEAISVQEILDALEEGTQAMQRLGELSDEALLATWRIIKDGQEIMAIPRIGLVRSILLNHWIHHRGQLSVYLRLLEVPVPAIYGVSADENPLGI